MHIPELILTLAGSLVAALILGYITHRIGLSPIVGYLLAGLAVGRHTPGFVADHDLTEQLAEIGVVLMMFGVGLHFHFRELLAVRRVALPGAVGQSLVATLLGCLVVLAFGWTWANGLVFGLAISVASTVVLLRVLSDHNDLHTPAGHIAVGWLVVEDLFTVFVLVLLPVLFKAESTGFVDVVLALGKAVVLIALFVAFMFLAGSYAIPWLLGQAAQTRSRELFTLTVLAVALGIAVGAAKVFEVSMPLGAFLAGMVVGRSDFSSRAASEALPMRDAFAVLFFVSVGMRFDPASLVQTPGLITATVAIVLIGKPLAALGIVLFRGYPLRTALAVAVALAQIGEFSFILVDVGDELKIFRPELTNALVVAAIVSISINPLLYRLVDVVEARAQRWPRLRRWVVGRNPVEGTQETAGAVGAQTRTVVVGYGPVGSTLVRLLRANEIEPTVIELNLTTVQRLRVEGIRAVYGDATHKETLQEAGIEGATALILSSSDMHHSEEAIRVAREATPGIHVLARSTYLREVAALRKAGADIVFAAEVEVALTMTEYLLRQLGATAEQIDRERERIRNEL